MPYVSENRTDDKLRVLHSYTSLGTRRDFGPVPWGSRFRSQYGWRSEGEAKAANDALTALRGANRSDYPALLDAIDRINRSMSSPIVRGETDTIVHDRRYVDSTYEGATGRWGLNANTGNGWSDYEGYTGIKTIDFDQPNIDDLRPQASELMRRSIPTAPAAGIAQFLGELRDLPMMFRKGNYYPTSTNDLGGGFLNVVFGIIPTVSDIKAAAKAVIDSRPLLEQYALDSGKLIHRIRSEPIYKNSFESTWQHVTKGGERTLTLSSDPLLRIKTSTTTGSIGNTGALEFKVECVVSSELRSFALWEYFAGDPSGGFLSKLDYYQRQAEQLLGRPFGSASVLWELTRWSWLIDWFTDIGGLLAFQQSVATDQLAARRSGFLYEHTVNGIIHVKGASNRSSYDARGQWRVPFHHRYQNRTKGTPYNMEVAWDFSPKQWFILGALGLTRAPGIGISS